MLRDEGRAYAARLREDGVDVEEVCYPASPTASSTSTSPRRSVAFERIGAGSAPAGADALSRRGVDGGADS